jgi:fluoride ion exporter CrcB/FEX
MIDKGEWASAVAYDAGSVILSVLSLFLGLSLIRAVAA